MTERTRRSAIITGSVLLLAGCSTPSDTQQPDDNDGVNGENELILIEQQNTEPLVFDTPRDPNEILFREKPDSNLILISKTVTLPDGCSQPNAVVNEVERNVISVEFQTVSATSNQSDCTSEREQEIFTVGVKVSELVANGELRVTTTNNSDVTYITTAESGDEIITVT